MNDPPPPSPMHPVAPPTKKQRSNPDALSSAADSAIARRRAELRRLQEMRASAPVIEQARTQLGGSAPRMPPASQRLALVRHSDIFPQVAKAPSTAKKPTPQVARKLDPSLASTRTPPPPLIDEDDRKSRAKSAPPIRPPPPPASAPPRTLSNEAPPSIQQPSSSRSERASPSKQPSPVTPHVMQSSEPTSTARRDTLRNLADSVDDVRMMRELRQAQEDRADALRKVARLREQVNQFQNEKALASSPAKPQQQASQVGFLSPLQASATPRHGSATPGGANMMSTRKRVSTPHPKFKVFSETKFLKQAAQSIPHEYYSAQATYTVRRPHVGETDDDLWNKTMIGMTTLEYQETANAHDASSIHVVAKIVADGSYLTLSGTCDVKHQIPGKEWKAFDNVDERDDPLGCILYIDQDANEKEYWLDAIYEEAFATREAYCSSLISNAFVLQTKQEEEPPPQAMSTAATIPQQPVAVKPQQVEKLPVTTDACVGTEDDLEDKTSAKKNPPTRQTQAAPAAEQAKKQPPPLEEENSTDIFSVFLGMIFSSLFGLIWLVLVRIPFRIFTFSMLLVTTGAFLSVVWLYLADDHGAQSMGAGGIPYGFNRVGIV